MEYSAKIQDIKQFSQRDPVRATILALGIAFGILMVNEILGLVLGLAIAWWQREQIIEKLDPFLDKYPWWIMLVMPMAVLAFAFQSPPSAVDDLLRHIVAYEYNYDYTQMMPHADLYHWSFWIGFDWLLGVFGRIGVLPQYVMWGVQLTALLAFTVVMCKAGCRVLPDDMAKAEKWYWKLGVFWLVLPMVIGRIGLGRPEIFMAIWVIAALVPKSRWQIAVWASAGLALFTGYWLAFLYIPAVMMLRGVSIQGRVALGVLLGLAHLVFWEVYSQGEYLHALLWLQKIVSHETVIKTAEISSMAAALMSPIFGLGLCLSIAGYVSADKKTRCKVLWVGVLLMMYMATNQIRYIGLVAPLMGLFLLYLYSEKMPKHLHYEAKLLMVGVALFGALNAVKGVSRYCEIPTFNLPEHAKVMTPFSWATYAVPFYNANKHVQVAPSMAIASSDHDIQVLAKNINMGNIDCQALRKYQFTHLVEQNLITQSIPECLQLEQTKRAWQLWSVKQ